MPTPIASVDIIDLQNAIDQNADVYAATLQRHNQSHSITSASDHSDVLGAPADDDLLIYDTSASKWKPMQLVVIADGGTR